MTDQHKVWVARNENRELRLFTSKPYWVSLEDDEGYWCSEHPNWQLNVDDHEGLPKGGRRLVKMLYNLVDFSNNPI